MKDEKKEKHEPKHEVKHEVKHEAKHETLVKTSKSNLVLGVILCLVVGFFIGFGASFYKGSVDPKELGPKVMTYVTDTFLAANSASANLTTVDEKFGMYEMNFDILQNGKVVQQAAKAYVSKDGKYLMVGQVFELSAKPSQPAQDQQQAPAQTEIPKTDKPNVKFFVMAFCPFGKQAEQGLGPAVAALGTKVVAEPHFVIYNNYNGGGDDYCMGDGKYCSMHGINELREDVRQMCVWKYKQAQWWTYVNKINEKCTVSSIDTCWKEVAKEIGFDSDKIAECEKDEALTLLEAEVKLNEKYGVQGSPTVLINDVDYSGGRSASAYLGGICSAFNTAPSECAAELAGTETASTGGCGG